MPFGNEQKKTVSLIRGFILRKQVFDKFLSLTLSPCKSLLQARVGILFGFPLSLFVLNSVCAPERAIVWPINVHSAVRYCSHCTPRGVLMCLIQNLSCVTSAQHELTIIKFPILSVVLTLALVVRAFSMRKKNRLQWQQQKISSVSFCVELNRLYFT